MWRQVGLEREKVELQDATGRLEYWASYVLRMKFPGTEGWRLQNMLTTAGLIAEGALQREESRGCHRRLDFPQPDDENWKRHISFRRNNENKLS